MTSGAVDREIERKANDLYWDSQWSVNQIAEELDLSKGTLYGLIRPRPSGLSCPDCSQEVVYPNRTAKERAQVACPSCGWEGEELDAEGNGGDTGMVPPSLEATTAPADPTSREAARRKQVLVGGALLGAAAGLALVLFVRRR